MKERDKVVIFKGRAFERGLRDREGKILRFET
jgi:hypothetical protein